MQGRNAVHQSDKIITTNVKANQFPGQSKKRNRRINGNSCVNIYEHYSIAFQHKELTNTAIKRFAARNDNVGISVREYEIFCNINIAAYSSYCLPQPLRIHCKHAGKTLLPWSVGMEETNAIICTLETARKKPIVSQIL